MLLLMLGAGCNMNAFTANTTAGVFEEAAPAFDEHWDYEFAGNAAPGNLMQLEGFLRIVPDNQTLLLQLAKGYAGYTYGWIEDEIERVDPSDFEADEHLHQRARLFYLRARDLGFRWLEEEAEGVTAMRRKPLAEFTKFLKEHYDSKEDAPGLFWAGYAWGSAINVSREDPDLIADLGYARALVDRSVELDSDYMFASGTVFQAVIKSDFPEALGGDPEGGKALFEKALAKTGRKVHLVQLNYARTYAVQKGDKKLFHDLLMEIVEAGDVFPPARLMNKIARRRAARYLENIDEYF
ncbi:MAG: TRAP transporter TatT component family protein [Polyangiales bacterium]